MTTKDWRSQLARTDGLAQAVEALRALTTILQDQINSVVMEAPEEEAKKILPPDVFQAMIALKTELLKRKEIKNET